MLSTANLSLSCHLKNIPASVDLVFGFGPEVAQPLYINVVGSPEVEELKRSTQKLSVVLQAQRITSTTSKTPFGKILCSTILCPLTQRDVFERRRVRGDGSRRIPGNEVGEAAAGGGEAG